MSHGMKPPPSLGEVCLAAFLTGFLAASEMSVERATAEDARADTGAASPLTCSDGWLRASTAVALSRHTQADYARGFRAFPRDEARGVHDEHAVAALTCCPHTHP